ncbi:MAG: 3-dehydroquinate synthase [Pseudomonadales bacterium]|nr:3-dehydroquinate synthase [Pseudomonadales bacterium]
MGLYKKIIAEFDGESYPIYIGKNIISDKIIFVREKTNNTNVLIVTDQFFVDTVAEKIKVLFESHDYNVHVFAMDAGKANKTIYEALKVYSILEENNFAKDSLLITIGGGVIGDLGGFVASTWLRGMKLVHVPTSLMAMIDSSIGGKTAVNFRHTINGIGNYYHPIKNIIDFDFINTLSDRDYRSGLAEVIKCAIISDEKFYRYLQNNKDEILARSHDHVLEFVTKTIAIKIKHVTGDVHEAGQRLLLNYGHTLGHAVEISTVRHHEEQLRHGEGVSIGIMAVAYIATHYLDVPQHVYDAFKTLFQAYGLPVDVSARQMGFKRETLLSACLKNINKDKKRLDNKIRLILSGKVGTASIHSDVPFELIEKAFDHIIKD